jgi:integration host factor subunit beta
MTTITKKELVEQVAQKTGADRGETRKIVLDAVIEELNQGNRLEFRDFGVFEVRQRAPRMAQNPKTLVPVKVPAKRSVRFKPGRLMREQGVVPAELANAQ